jgi:protein-ribulosamine 3-kinase
MLYLCEKYAPLESLERYRPENDVSVTGAYVQHETHMMKDAHLNQTTMSSASQSIHT